MIVLSHFPGNCPVPEPELPVNCAPDCDENAAEVIKTIFQITWYVIIYSIVLVIYTSVVIRLDVNENDSK